MTALLTASLAASAGCAHRPTGGAGADEPIAPLDGVAAPARERAQARLTLDTPIDSICASPGGKAVLDRDLPGLTDHPDYAMFKMLSLHALANMAAGKLTDAKLAQVQADLARLPPQGATAAAAH